MSILEELTHELNEMFSPLWLFPEHPGDCSETDSRLFSVVRETLAWAVEGEWSLPAFVITLFQFLLHNPQEGKILH